MKIKSNFKRGLSIILICAFMLSLAIPAMTLSAMAVTTPKGSQTVAGFPNAYWALQEKYTAAKTAKNNAEIIKIGEQIITLFCGSVNKTQPEWKKIAEDYLANKALDINVMDEVSLNVARAYEALNKFADARRTYIYALEFVYAYQELNNISKTEREFQIVDLKNKISYYSTDIAKFYGEIPAQEIVYRWAKHEPKTGVYYGESSNMLPDGTAPKASAKEKDASASLIYVLYEEETIESYDWLIKPTSQNKSIVQIAWNLKNEGNTLAQVLNDKAKIESAATYLKNLGTPILLRFGAEMNVWEKAADPQKFIAAFKFIADIMHKTAPNVAMVWSVNSISAEGKNYAMFYPGDEYVDWVGISLYTMQYFNGDKNQSEAAQSIYLTGKYANSITLLKPLVDFVETLKQKKPIMIAEGGIENYSITNKTSDLVWADKQMRLFYSVPMIYPQVKAIFYFNAAPIGVAKSRFNLYESPEMSKLYTELTAGSYFIKGKAKESTISFKEISANGVVNFPANKVHLNSYAPIFAYGKLTKTYKLDGKWVGAGERLTFDFSAQSNGLHTLVVDIADSTGAVIKTVTLYMKKDNATVSLSTQAIK